MLETDISQLVEALETHTLALFVGSDLPREITGLPSRAELGRELAQRHGREALSLAEAASWVSSQGTRFEYTDFLLRKLDTTGKSPQRFHQCLVRLAQPPYNVKTVITTAFDNLLALAFDRARVGRNAIVRNNDLRFVNPTYCMLIWLYGKVEQVDSLVVTKHDHWDLLRNRDREDVLAEVKRTFQQKTVLFLGYDFTDPDFHFLYSQVAESHFAHTAYAAWPGLSRDQAREWRNEGVIILDAGPLAILERLLSPEQPLLPPESQQGSQEPVVPASVHPPIAVVRDLLQAAFSEETLRRFCQDRPDLYDLGVRFSRSDGLADLVDKVIDYCGEFFLWDKLLSEVKEFNPRQHVHFVHMLLMDRDNTDTGPHTAPPTS